MTEQFPAARRVHRVEEISVVEQGEGPPLLLLHGIGSAGTTFGPQIDALSASWRCLAWDAPGYGASGAPADTLDMDGYAEAALRVLEALAGQAAHVLGVSWGGVIAVRLALRFPEAARSLVLANSMRGGAVDPQRADALRKRADDLAAQGAAEFARAGTARTLTEQAPAELVDAVARQNATALRVDGYRMATESLAETDHTDRLGEIEAPTLVVAGEQDVIAPPAESQRLADGIPGARMVTIPGAGHLSNVEQPDAFNRVVAEFLEQVDRERD